MLVIACQLPFNEAVSLQRFEHALQDDFASAEPMLQAQTSISSAWQPPAAGVTAADDGMARTASMPDSFGSSVRCQQPCSGAGQGLPTVFTVTTGDIAMPSSHADESSPEPDEAAVQQQQTGVSTTCPFHITPGQDYSTKNSWPLRSE